MSRPSVRKREKKVAREQKARAKVTARRERLQAAMEAAAAPDPRRNLHLERGRPVVVNDITPYARAKCGKCKGRGIVGMSSDAEGNKVGAHPCRCSTVRFYRVHPEIIVDETGRAWWPADAS